MANSNNSNSFQRDMAKARQRQAAQREAQGRGGQEPGREQPPAEGVTWRWEDDGRPSVAQEAHTSLTPRTHAERNA